MTVGTLIIDGEKVADLDSFEFTPTVEAPVDWMTRPMLPAGMYQAITLPFAVPEPTHVRQVPKGRWVGGIKDAPDARVYVVSGRRVGLVRGPLAMMAPRGSAIKLSNRRCESKRWVERTYAEAWYREEMWFQRLRAMGWRTVADMKAGG